MQLGYEPKALLEESDLVIVLEVDVPWLPSLENPPKDTKVVHIGRDPSYVNYPTRSFRSDLSIVADAGKAMRALEAALTKLGESGTKFVPKRRENLAARRSAIRSAWAAAREAAAQSADIKPEWISHCIAQAIDDDTIVVNEYPLRLPHCPRETSTSFYGQSPAGGLGWGLGAAIGAKLAAKDKTVVVTLGDGAYMFGQPDCMSLRLCCA